MKFPPLLLFLLIVSCTSLKKSTTNSSTEETTTKVASKIIFLNYKISKDSNTNTNFTLINKIITDGHLKKRRKTATSRNPRDLICLQQDINSKIIDSIYIKNPLLKNVEFADPSGELGRKTIELNSTTISVRMDLNPQTKFITLKLTNNTNNSLLKTQL
ncbi:hypothetical protein MPF19_17230 [Polaribacter sp. Z014]|uniref:hypothetical protein n=1 Tax=Polaribacter sp. Z014 TaxID=2927126 RepID=UPI00202004A1|nr:hypothetical protein [Polaribacter sp. Z014]MCL7765169.1 hypothetical protein [Polaribacter sp. Z014]